VERPTTGEKSAVRQSAASKGDYNQVYCADCNNHIRHSDRRATCNLCQATYHFTCADINRKDRENLQNWKCHTCKRPNDAQPNNASHNNDYNANTANRTIDNISNTTTTANNLNRPKTTCAECKRTIRIGHRRKKCTTCPSQFHIYHLGNTRKACEDALDNNTWRCQPCKGTPTNNTQQQLNQPNTFAKPSLNILQWNSDGINTKLEELEQVLRKYDIDIACIQESKMAPKDTSPNINGYNTIRKDRHDTSLKRGGGLITLLKKGIHHQAAPTNDIRGLESLTVELATENEEPLFITNAYLPPTTSEYLARQLQGEQENINILVRQNEVITADLNAHDPLWDQHSNSNQRGEELVEYLLDNQGVIHNIDESFTRHSADFTSKSSPDVTISHEQNSNTINNWHTITELSSDHLPILFRIDTATAFNTNNNTTRKTWNWKEANWTRYTSDLEQKAEEIDTTNKSAYMLEKEIRKAILKSAYDNVGLKKVGNRSKQYLPENIQESIQLRNTLRSHNNPEHTLVSQRIKEEIRDYKRQVWKDKVLTDKDANKMWSTLKQLQGQDNNNSDKALNTSTGARLTDRSKANAFKAAYANVSRTNINKSDRWIKKNINHTLRQGYEPNTKIEHAFTNTELNKSINEMAPNKAAGPDHIHPKLIIALGPKMRNCLLSLFNTSWRKGQVPQQWRTADIRPVPKRGKDPSLISSHRPISLTSCVGKLMERMVTKRITYALEHNELLAPQQAGFRQKRSTEDQVIRLSQWINDGFQKKPMHRTLLALLDLSKAYDTVWRDGLIYKMAQHKIDTHAIRWTQSWLTNRRNYVTINNTTSKTTTFKQGVPQGSVISPLLFLIYMNDITSCIREDQANISLFADDIAVYASGRNKDTLQNQIQNTISNISEWADKWKLKINADKCSTTIFSNDSKDAKWEAKISIKGKNLKADRFPSSLGLPSIALCHSTLTSTKMPPRSRTELTS